MRWATYTIGGAERIGVVEGRLIYGLPPGNSLVDLLAGGPTALFDAGERARQKPHGVVDLGNVTLLSPIPRPPAVRDFLCYLDHMRNCRAALGSDAALEDVWYQVPAMYFGCPATVVGPYADVHIPPGCQAFDFELEIGAVIGSGGRDLSPQQGEDAIAGYLIYCDWSARDLQALEAGLRIGQAKGKDGATTLGPVLVTADELDSARVDGRLVLSVEAWVNDRRVGTGNTTQMDWSFGEMACYASRGVELRPGDVLGSGTVPTCTLVEHARDAGFGGWLTPGDVVTLRVQHLGETRQTVRAPAAEPWPLPPRPQPA